MIVPPRLVSPISTLSAGTVVAGTVVGATVVGCVVAGCAVVGCVVGAAVVAGVSASDLDNIIRNYETFDFKSVIVTKCDETKRFGRIISVLSERNKPVSWVATGQEIFKTIQPASKAFFLKRLTGFNVDAHFIEKKFGSADKELEVSE